MATTTPNFGWAVPTSTDLVKDGAVAIETLGDSIDASLVDLKGGTTGQVLAKATNTDMDFTWVAQDDSNAIQNALLTTTGDTIYASGASTPARRAIGTTGQVLTVSGGVPVWATPATSTPTFVGCDVYQNTAQSIPSGTHTTVTYELEYIDTDGFHSTSTNTSRITIPSGKAGKYRIFGQVNFDTLSTTNVRASIALNGTRIRQTISTGLSQYSQVTVEMIKDLAVGDYVEIQAFQASGISGVLTVGDNLGYNHFSAEFLGA